MPPSGSTLSDWGWVMAPWKWLWTWKWVLGILFPFYGCYVSMVQVIWMLAGGWALPSEEVGWWHSQLNGKIKVMFQTTNQISVDEYQLYVWWISFKNTSFAPLDSLLNCPWPRALYGYLNIKHVEHPLCTEPRWGPPGEFQKTPTTRWCREPKWGDNAIPSGYQTWQAKWTIYRYV